MRKLPLLPHDLFYSHQTPESSITLLNRWVVEMNEALKEINEVD
jgi:hypothetical protein